MPRHIFQGTFTDGMGRVVLSGTVSVYLAGTTTPASVYVASSGGVAVNSITSSAIDGSFSFYVSDTDYNPSQRFDAILSKTHFISRTLHDIEIFKSEGYIGDYADLVVFLSGVGSNERSIVICGTIVLAAVVTIPANVSCRVIKGGSFTGCGSFTLAINGSFSAGLYQVFDGAVTFGESVSILYPRWWGAMGDDSTDDTVALQACINAALASLNPTIHLSDRVYKTTAALSVTAALKIEGSGRATSAIKCYTAAQNGITINTNEALILRDFGIWAGTVKTAGAAVWVGSSTVNSGSVFDNLYVNGHYFGIQFVTAAGWKVSNCDLHFLLAGMDIQNTHNVDEGDSCISGCLFNGTTDTYGIVYRDSGGLRIENNKFLGGNYSIYMALTDAAVTGVLLIIGNSIEGAAIAGAAFVGPATTGSFDQIVITGNEIWTAGHGITFASATAKSFRSVNITGNNIRIPINTNGIALAEVSRAIVSANIIEGLNTGEVGLLIAASCEHIAHGPNLYHGIATPVTNGAADTTTVAFA